MECSLSELLSTGDVHLVISSTSLDGAFEGFTIEILKLNIPTTYTQHHRTKGETTCEWVKKWENGEVCVGE